MAGRSLDEILAPEVIIRDVVLRKVPATALSKIFGWSLPDVASFNMGGEPTGNVIDSQLRDGKFDIISETDEIVTASVPGTPATARKPQIVGKVPFTIPRSHEFIDLLYEEMNQRRPFGGSVNMVDRGGERFIRIQEDYLAKLFANFIEFQTAAMLRGSYTYDQQGDQLRHGFTGGETTIDFQIPAGNKTTLDMTGAGAIIGTDYWSTTSNNIPAQLYKINAAMVQNTGRGLRHIVLNSTMFQYVINNDFLKAQAGTAAMALQDFAQTGAAEFEYTFKSLPFFKFHVIDYTLQHWDGSAFASTLLAPDGKAGFIADVDSDWVQYSTCMETVVEGQAADAPESDRWGLYFWSERKSQPAGRRIFGLLNGMPMLYNPKCIAWGSITA